MKLLLYRVLALATALAVFAAVQPGTPPYRAEATGATLAFPTASCSGSSATVGFSWTSGATETWIDLSMTDNGFVAGSYQTAGPFAGGVSSYSWSGLKTYEPYFWRVGSRSAAGIEVSETGVFVVCSEPILLASNPECNGKPEATVSFRWAPSVPATQQQWIDLSTQNTFSTGTFSSYGSFSAGTNAFKLDRVGSGTYFYRVGSQLQDGSGRSSITRTFTVACAAGADTDLHSSGDKLVYAALGIVAPVNVRKIGPDGTMLNPEGMDDVVRYDFSGLQGLGGYPGNGGTTALAGHLDYRPYYPAVFYNLTKAKQGDVIEYRRADGVTKKFTVAWSGSVPFEQSLSEYLASTNPESMVLITCDGGFDEAIGGYARRAIVYAVASN